MLTIAGSSTSSSDAALKVGTATLWVGNDGSIGIGTTTPSATGYKVWVGGNSFLILIYMLLILILVQLLLIQVVHQVRLPFMEMPK